MQHLREREDLVRIEMSVQEWEHLLLMIGVGAGASGGPPIFWEWIKLANAFNTGNPNFEQYAIPEQFRIGIFDTQP